jgi:uncharacterized membrane protein
MPEIIQHILFPLARWLHLLASTLIVGGTVFFEFVVPRGIEELKLENQLSIIAYLRLVFRKIVWISVVLLPITGAVALYQQWPGYVGPNGMLSPAAPWAIAHIVLSALALALAVALVIGRSVPLHARGWMKINFVLLMSAMFIASASRHVRLFTRERVIKQELHPGQPMAPYTMP